MSYDSKNMIFIKAIYIIAFTLICSFHSTYIKAQQPTGTDNYNQQLLDATKSGDEKKVRELLNYDVDVNTTNQKGSTVLLKASELGYLEIVRDLLNANADVNIKNREGVTALMIASLNGHAEIVQTLLNTNVNVNEKDNTGLSALMFATTNNHLEIVKILIKSKANVDSKEQNGLTPLMAASALGNDQIVQALLNAKADVNARNFNGSTAIMIASEYDNTNIVKLLTKAGAINDRSNIGENDKNYTSIKRDYNEKESTIKNNKLPNTYESLGQSMGDFATIGCPFAVRGAADNEKEYEIMLRNCERKMKKQYSDAMNDARKQIRNEYLK